MSSTDALVDPLVVQLEDALRSHGVAPAKGYLRDTAAKNLKQTMGAPLSESTIQNSVHELQRLAPDKAAFAAEVERLRQKRTPCLGNFLVLLKEVNSDSMVKQMLTSMAPAEDRYSLQQGPAAVHTPSSSLAAVRTPVPAVPAAGAYGRSTRAAAARTTAAPDPAYSNVSTNNLFDDQENHLSPLLADRKRVYTPRTAAHPTLPDVGDLLRAQPVPRGPHRPPPHLARIPAWNYQRPHLTGLHILEDAAREVAAEGPPLDSLPQSVQEVTALKELLLAFTGRGGSVFKPEITQVAGATRISFSAPKSLHPCISEIVQRMLPICEYVVVLKRFIETRSSYLFGMVSQALAAAMRERLAEWTLMVAQMEHQYRLGKLTMQAALYYCQEPQHQLHLLASIAAAAACQPQLTSAGTLDLLHARWAGLVGDPPARALVHALLAAAAVPYFRALEAWLFRGVLDDPYAEFMVQEDAADLSVDKSNLTADGRLAYWYQRYTIRQRPPAEDGIPTGDDVPVMLRKVAEVVLTTGKYLNTMRECGQRVDPPAPAGTRLQYDAAQGYVVLVERAHQHASALLLDFLWRDRKLQECLESVKHCFLLDKGDFMVHLLESAKGELSKPAKKVSRSRMQSLLELAVNDSGVIPDPDKKTVHLDLNPRPLHELVRDAFPELYARTSGTKVDVAAVREDYKGWQALMLGYRVEWPLTLVVAQRQVQQYQLIFKHLFTLKFAERELATSWHLLQCTRYLDREGFQRLRTAHAACNRMMFVVQESLRYATTDVLEPSWATLLASARKATNIDQVIDSHNEFLQRALAGMLLTHKGVVRMYPALLQACFDFCAAIDHHLGPVTDHCLSTSVDGLVSKSRAQRDAMRQQRAVALRGVAQDPSFIERTAALRADFDARSRELLAAFSAHIEAMLRSQDGGPAQPGTKAAAPTTGATPAGAGQASADCREEVEGLRNLIDRLSF